MKKELLKGNAVVGQSGGPTAAINATLSGVVRGALGSAAIDKIYGALNGMEGLLEGRVIDLTERLGSESELKLLEATPAAALGSCRLKLPDPNEQPEVYARLFEVFDSLGIKYFFYIGGNDSMDTVAKVSAYAGSVGSDVRVMGVPKTIDNDLCETDHTPGFGSAAKYIATVMQEILRDTAVYTVKAVTVVEIMGRDSGWLTAAAAIPRRLSDVEPDLVYLPEVPFDFENMFADVEKLFERKPNIVIAISEGARLADGTYVGAGTQNGVSDVFGHKYLGGTGKAVEQAIKSHFGCKVRTVELNLPQRCAAHAASLTDINESIAVGRAAVSCAERGESGKIMCLVRANGDYAITYEPHDIAPIANKIKEVPREFINESGNNVTDECIDYLLPLIKGEAECIYRDGLPLHINLKNTEKSK